MRSLTRRSQIFAPSFRHSPVTFTLRVAFPATARMELLTAKLSDFVAFVLMTLISPIIHRTRRCTLFSGSKVQQAINSARSVSRPDALEQKPNNDATKSSSPFTVKNYCVFYSVLLLNSTANDCFRNLQWIAVFFIFISVKYCVFYSVKCKILRYTVKNIVKYRNF